MHVLAPHPYISLLAALMSFKHPLPSNPHTGKVWLTKNKLFAEKDVNLKKERGELSRQLRDDTGEPQRGGGAEHKQIEGLFACFNIARLCVRKGSLGEDFTEMLLSLLPIVLKRTSSTKTLSALKLQFGFFSLNFKLKLKLLNPFVVVFLRPIIYFIL